MSTNIYKQIKGERVELTARQVKAEIMSIRGWTSEEYQREYDKLRNKLRAYEAFEKSRLPQGEQFKSESPANFLYREAKSMQRYGESYRPSARTANIRSAPSISSGKALTNLITSEANKMARNNYLRNYSRATAYSYENFIKNVPQAAEIVEKIKDPIKQRQALAALADKLHAREDDERRIAANSEVPFVGSGSTAPIDFDITAWL